MTTPVTETEAKCCSDCGKEFIPIDYVFEKRVPPEDERDGSICVNCVPELIKVLKEHDEYDTAEKYQTELDKLISSTKK